MTRLSLAAMAGLLVASCTCGGEPNERAAVDFVTAVEQLSVAVCERAAECGQTPPDRLANCIGEVKSRWLPPGLPAPVVELVVDLDACTDAIRHGACERSRFEILRPLEGVVSLRCPTAQLRPTGESGSPCAVDSPLRQCRGERAGCFGDAGCLGRCVDDLLGGEEQPRRAGRDACLPTLWLDIDDRCHATRPLDAPCDLDVQCQSGICEFSVDGGQSRCGGRWPGEECDVSRRCREGWCQRGVCPRHVAAGETCVDFDVACGPGTRCEAGVCARVPDAGERCVPDVTQCQASVCPRDGLCPFEPYSVAVGGACRSAADCARPSEVSLDVTCRDVATLEDGGPGTGICGTPALGDRCVADASCPADSVCWDGACVATRAEPTCADQFSCGVNRCDDAGCVLALRATGEPCVFGECADPRDVCGSTDAVGGNQRCRRRPGIGDRCDLQMQCQRGLLCERGFCLAAGNVDEPCLSNDFCVDGSCGLDGRCTGSPAAAICQ